MKYLEKKKNLLNKVENGFLMSKKSKIIVTGGTGRFGSVLKAKFKESFIFPNKKELDILNVGNYKETDAVYPCNNYAWSKLGGESAVHMYKNSLILRVSMTEKPFVHKSAYANMITNFIFHEEVIPILKKVMHKKGIINIGGPTKTVYSFAKKYNPKIKKIFIGKKNNLMPKNSSMNLSKMRKLI